MSSRALTPARACLRPGLPPRFTSHSPHALRLLDTPSLATTTPLQHPISPTTCLPTARTGHSARSAADHARLSKPLLARKLSLRHDWLSHPRTAHVSVQADRPSLHLVPFPLAFRLVPASPSAGNPFRLFFDQLLLSSCSKGLHRARRALSAAQQSATLTNPTPLLLNKHRSATAFVADCRILSWSS